MSLKYIGVHNIVAPAKPDLNFEDGWKIFSDDIKPLIPSLLDERSSVKINLLIPEGLETPYLGADEWSDATDFFIGAIGGLYVAARNKKFPEVEVAHNKQRIRGVPSAHDDKPADAPVDVLTRVFSGAWKSYAPLENFMKERLCVGVLHRSGEITLYDEAEISNEMLWWGYRYDKAISGMELNNLSIVKELADEHGFDFPSL